MIVFPLLLVEFKIDSINKVHVRSSPGHSVCSSVVLRSSLPHSTSSAVAMYFRVDIPGAMRDVPTASCSRLKAPGRGIYFFGAGRKIFPTKGTHERKLIQIPI